LQKVRRPRGRAREPAARGGTCRHLGALRPATPASAPGRRAVAANRAAPWVTVPAVRADPDRCRRLAPLPSGDRARQALALEGAD